MQAPESRLTADLIQARLDEMLDAVLSSGRNTARSAEQLALCDAEQKAFVLHWLDVIVRTNSELGFQFVTHVPRALAKLDLEQVEKWLINAMDDLKVSNDTKASVRNTANRIIQFEYGEDGTDPARSRKGSPFDVDQVLNDALGGAN